MTREEARKAAEVMMAYADGKKIECRLKNDCDFWVEPTPNKDGTLDFDWNMVDYRIKKEPTYRPFKDKEECWNEMLKHQPFGWAMARGGSRPVITIGRDYVCFAAITLDYNEAFKEVKFIDGTPFGIKED